MSRPSIVIADDHRVVIEGVKRILEADFDVTATVEDGDELVSVAARLRPDVIVTDISMPSLDGVRALGQILEDLPETRIIVLSMHREESYAVWALRAGASGYVLKHSDPDELVTAIHEALAGCTFVSPSIAEAVWELLEQRRPTANELEGRQRDVLRLCAKGRTIKQIAGDLGVSPKTVEYHKYRLMELLGVKTTAELVRVALEQDPGSGL